MNDYLISRLDALVAIQETPWYSQDKNKEMTNGAWDEHIGWYKAYDIYQALEQLPSAQPEIIRCKDCKYMTEHYDADGNAPYWTCSEWDSGTDYDGFCHYAERRTDE